MHHEQRKVLKRGDEILYLALSSSGNASLAVKSSVFVRLLYMFTKAASSSDIFLFFLEYCHIWCLLVQHYNNIKYVCYSKKVSGRLCEGVNVVMSFTVCPV